MPSTAFNNMGRGRRPAQALSIMEGEWRPSYIETCRIINVNIEDWSVDCISEYSNKRFFDIQVSSPYFHIAGGEGIYVQPEAGAMCWVCVPSGGRFAAPFVMGFQSAHDESFDGFRGGRQTLNPGDIMLRTRDENFILLRRGGVVQIGATPTAQRFYIPIRNFIRDFCENYEMFTFGGDLTWITERDDKTTDGAALTKFSLRAKEKSDNKEHIATLTIGSHGEDSTTTLQLDIHESGDEGSAVVAHTAITKEGEITWQLKKSWEATIDEGDYSVHVTKGKVVMDSGDTTSFVSQKDMLVKSSSGKATMDGMKEATLKSATKAMLDAPVVHLGNGATSPVIKGDMLVSLLSSLISQISSFAAPPGTAGGPIIAAAGVASLAGQLQGLLSTTSFTK
jgi:hypothetical protein